MRRPMLLAMLVLVCCLLQAPPAHAAPGMKLRWDECSADGGATNKDFACDTNAGTDVLVLSYESPVTLDSLSGFETFVRFQSSTLFPNWWLARGTGFCRNGALTADRVPPVSMTNCVDHFLQQASGGIGLYNLGLDSGAQLNSFFSIPMTAIAPLQAGSEMYLMSIRIKHTKTVGTGSCSGCTVPMCIGFGAMIAYNGYATFIRVTQTEAGPSNVGWQGGTSPGMQVFNEDGHLVHVYLSCAGATPTQNRTWGAIKTLYH